jgi:hypothetical protein
MCLNIKPEIIARSYEILDNRLLNKLHAELDSRLHKIGYTGCYKRYKAALTKIIKIPISIRVS